MRANWSQWASLSGLVFAGLLIAVILAGGNTPDSDWSAQRVVAYYTTHHKSQNAITYLVAYGALFALVFAAVLLSRLLTHTNLDGLIAVGFGGGIALAVGMAILSAITASTVDEPAKISPAAEQALSVLSNNDIIPLLVGLVAFMVGNGLAIVRSRALPIWLGWAAIVIGIVAAIPQIGFFALAGVIIWAAIASITMFVRAGQAPAAAAATAA